MQRWHEEKKAFSLCQGDYIQWLDADDLLAPGKINRQMEAWKDGLSSRTLLSSEWAYFIWRPRSTKFIPSPLWDDLCPMEWLLRKMGQNLHMQPASWLVSRELKDDGGTMGYHDSRSMTTANISAG